MYVYLVTCLTPIRVGKDHKLHHKTWCKIGIAQNIQKRISLMQTGNPLKLTLLASMRVTSRRAALSIEAALHSQLADRRKMGEWFDLSFRHQAIVAMWFSAGNPETEMEAFFRETDALLRKTMD